MKKYLLFIIYLLSQPIFGQTPKEISCRYPINVPADSLVKFVIQDFYQYRNQSKVDSIFNSDNFSKYHYDSTVPINYDSIFQICIKHLKKRLGDEFVCKNTFLGLGSFSISENKQDFSITFSFIFTTLKKDSPQRIKIYTTINNEISGLTFKYSINYKGEISIVYPYVPKCINQETCDIIITKNKAINIFRGK